LRAIQRANLAALRARVKAILKRTAEGHAYFDAIIAGKPAIKPTIPASSTKSRSAVTVAPYSTTMHGSASPPTPRQVDVVGLTSPVKIDISQRLFDALVSFSHEVGKSIDDLAEHILVSSLPFEPAALGEASQSIHHVGPVPDDVRALVDRDRHATCACCRGYCRDPVNWRGKLRCGCPKSKKTASASTKT
jgi:hypothetical protein